MLWNEMRDDFLSNTFFVYVEREIALRFGLNQSYTVFRI